jgi:hypothetical protein
MKIHAVSELEHFAFSKVINAHDCAQLCLFALSLGRIRS